MNLVIFHGYVTALLVYQKVILDTLRGEIPVERFQSDLSIGVLKP